jgi:IS30 family transposase
MLTVDDRVEISTGLKEGWFIRAIAAHIDRSPSVVSGEVGRSATNARGYMRVSADCTSRRRGRRPQLGKVAADEALRIWVLANLSQPRTPRQVAGRLRLGAQDETLGLMKDSRPSEGKTASPESIDRLVSALPTGNLAGPGVLLRSKPTHRRPPKRMVECGAPIVGMSPSVPTAARRRPCCGTHNEVHRDAGLLRPPPLPFGTRPETAEMLLMEGEEYRDQ